MRPPILYLSIAFGLGLSAVLSGRGEWGVVLPVLMGAALLVRRAPLAAPCGLMLVAGAMWGGAARRERGASCAGRWTSLQTHSAVIQLTDPVPASGGVTEGVVRAGPCRGALTVRWPDGHPAHGGTTWVVAGRFLPDARGGILVARRVRFTGTTGSTFTAWPVEDFAVPLRPGGEAWQ